MAGDILNKYGTSNQTITITITSLTDTSVRASTAVDFSSATPQDAGVMVKIKTNASGTSATGYVQIYAFGTTNGGTDYTGGASGTDGAYSGLTAALIPLGRIPVTSNAQTVTGGPWSLASAFGFLPDHAGIAVENRTGATLDASVGSAWYQAVYGQYT